MLIEIPANATAVKLYNLCLKNGIRFIGFRAKQAKAKYIQAIETYNESIKPAILAVAGPVAQVTIGLVAIILTLVVMGAVSLGKLPWGAIALKSLGYVLIAFDVASRLVFDKGDRSRFEVGDRFPA
jgi:hypothetical protein